MQSFAVVDTLDAGHHGGCRAARHGNERHDVARVRAGARQRRRDGDDRRRDDHVRLRGIRRPARSASTSPSPTGSSDATGTARITVLPADAPPQLATAPVVAFVHPQEDATLDVFSRGVEPDAAGAAAQRRGRARPMPERVLSVDAVGQSNLRVSGTTASGGAGRLGTVSYVVSDGTEDRGARVEGEATVYLLPPAPELAPIAVDDTVVVRAGAQIDIPVLDNDLSPAGGRPTLNPAVGGVVRGRRARIRLRRPAALPRPDQARRVRRSTTRCSRPAPRRWPTPPRCTCACSATTPTAPRARDAGRTGAERAVDA